MLLATHHAIEVHVSVWDLLTLPQVGILFAIETEPCVFVTLSGEHIPPGRLQVHLDRAGHSLAECVVVGPLCVIVTRLWLDVDLLVGLPDPVLRSATIDLLGE